MMKKRSTKSAALRPVKVQKEETRELATAPPDKPPMISSETRETLEMMGVATASAIGAVLADKEEVQNHVTTRMIKAFAEAMKK